MAGKQAVCYSVGGRKPDELAKLKYSSEGFLQ